jgi:hypothetical protein
MVDKRLELAGLGRDGKLQHDLLAFRELVQLLEDRRKQEIVALGAVGALDVHLGLDDRHQAMRDDLLGKLELLGDSDGDSRRIGGIDD